LTFVLIAFAAAISLAISLTNHYILREQVLNNRQFQIQQIEHTVIHSLTTLEKSYYLFDRDTVNKMKEASAYLQRLYEENPSFEEWDFDELKERLGMDIYIIDERNVIIHSSFDPDVGLDFWKCCGKLAKVLEERRNAGGFFADGIDLEQYTGNIKKYSYMATHDKKYLIQLGFSLADSEIFKEFNFLHVIAQLEKRYPTINEINVLNIGGLALGEPIETGKLPKERRSAFERALQTKQTTEIKGVWKNEPAIYRYVPYTSSFDDGTTKMKVLEIIYNEEELKSVLDENKRKFVIQLLIILAITIVVASAISRWVAKPMYLAFHDSLTGLKNRAAFDETMAAALADQKRPTAVMMIDVDNFKWINDHKGHAQGDHYLKVVARTILSAVRKEDTPIRLGGDEFVLVMPGADQQLAEQTAQKLIETIKAATAQCLEHDGEQITVSIGISLAPEHGADAETLCRHADIALYAAKEKGKNQYQVYERT
jgi:diguanylate cyclase (GGDEF)-like protein